MRKFTALLKKEIKENITPQTLIPLLIGVLFFVFIGKIMGNETKKIKEPQNVAVLDLDDTSFSKFAIDSLGENNFKVTAYKNQDIQHVIDDARKNDTDIVMVIPSGFEKGISEFEPQQIDTYSIINNFSVMSAAGTQALKDVIEAINQYTSSQMITSKDSSANPEDLKNPIKTKDFVIISDKQANVDAGQVTGFITSQSAFIPIIMFLVIMLSAQMIAVAIASEKENKTFETLLSTPISRISLVSAKMIAAGLVSLLTAVIYMFGFKYYMNGFTGEMTGEMSSPAANEAIKQLGLSLDTKGYILLGISLFLSILIALAISLILGVFAEDVKKVQGLITPLTFLILIPYLLTMLVDINSVSPIVKYLIYAIPFSHPFLASPNLFLHRYDAVILGIVYQAVLFIILVITAGRIFSSDKIFTMKLNFRRNK